MVYFESALSAETTVCYLPIEKKHLERFLEIAFQDMAAFFEKRPELEKHRFCIVLAEEGASHYVSRGGFRCLSLYTFFKKANGCRDFHPLRHTRVDFGFSEFGLSSWIKHPGDRGFAGRGVNCYGRSIPFEPDDTYESAIERYLKTTKTDGAARLRGHPFIVLYPETDMGKIINQEK